MCQLVFPRKKIVKLLCILQNQPLVRALLLVEGNKASKLVKKSHRKNLLKTHGAQRKSICMMAGSVIKDMSVEIMTPEDARAWSPP